MLAFADAAIHASLHRVFEYSKLGRNWFIALFADRALNEVRKSFFFRVPTRIVIVLFMRPTDKRLLEVEGIQPALLFRPRDSAAFSRATSSPTRLSDNKTMN